MTPDQADNIATLVEVLRDTVKVSRVVAQRQGPDAAIAQIQMAEDAVRALQLYVQNPKKRNKPNDPKPSHHAACDLRTQPEQVLVELLGGGLETASSVIFPSAAFCMKSRQKARPSTTSVKRKLRGDWV